MRKKILVVLPLTEEEKTLFTDQTKDIEKEIAFTFHAPGEYSPEEIASANIIIGSLKPHEIKAARNLEWFQGSMAGMDKFTAPGIVPEHVVLTNAAGAYGLTVSEHMLASTFSLIRHFPEYMRRQASHKWETAGTIISVQGSTVLVMGMGDIGGQYARKMKALGAYVIGIRRTEKEKPDYVDEQYTMEHLDQVIGRADIVAMILPASKSTEKLMDRRLLHQMKKGSYLINCGRGNAIDSDALKEALDEGWIAGAALDVTDPEPLPVDDSLWDYENVLITPHCAGHFFLRQTLHNVIQISTENLGRYIRGEALKNVVNRRTGY